MCKIKMLTPGVTFNGLIVRDTFGHIFFTDFNNPKIDLSLIESNLRMVGANIVEKISGDKSFLRDRILALNKQENLPGINKPDKHENVTREIAA